MNEAESEKRELDSDSEPHDLGTRTPVLGDADAAHQGSIGGEVDNMSTGLQSQTPERIVKVERKPSFFPVLRVGRFRLRRF
jgi:hypothetical protein